MRQIYKRRKRLNLLGFFGTVIIIAMHYLLTNLYLATWVLINYYILNSNVFFLDINFYNWILFYFVFIAPGLNALFHIIYRDTGTIIWRMFLWLSIIVIIFGIPFFIFI